MADDVTQTPGVRLLCPTRWTVRAEALHSILSNYSYLQELWDWSLDNSSDTEMKASIRGVSIHMKSFEFYFGLHLGEILLSQADNLSRCLQSKDLSAAEGQAVAATTVNSLQDQRNDDKFNKFWVKVCSNADNEEVDTPSLP